MSPIPTLGEVDRIANLPEPVVRNLLITQCYYELSGAMVARTGSCANWCTFATWASKQAGQSIRKEDLKRALEELLSPAAVDRLLENVVRKTKKEQVTILQQLAQVFDPAVILERSGSAVARGNQKVFAEIGYEFTRFLAAFREERAFDEEKIARFLGGLRMGDPPDGQRYLQQAFRRYYQAFFEPEPTSRAELILLANIEIGFHEQTRLQPEIAEALNASVGDPDQLMWKLLKALFPYRSRLLYLYFGLRRWIGRPSGMDTAIHSLLSGITQKIRRLLTQHLMVLGLPEGRDLPLGEDLTTHFPVSLQQLRNPELKAFLQQIDPTPDSLRDTGAIDWADLPDRLHFIVDLFRTHHETLDLLEPPFTPGQVARLKEGAVPEGEL